jgi:hypothetical protein
VAATLSSLQKYGEKAAVDAWWLTFPFQNIPPLHLGRKLNSKLERCLTSTYDPRPSFNRPLGETLESRDALISIN